MRRPQLSPYVSHTALEGFSAASEILDADLLLKCEHRQHTGSFKVRGALSALLAAGPERRERGVVTASSGNHGLGVAFALRALGGTGVVFVPEGASPVKVAAIERLGAQVRYAGTHTDQAEAAARQFAGEQDRDYISPYNDPDVIAGQGSIGAEIVEQAGDQGLDAVVVAVGGGGLVAGVAAAVKSSLPDVRVIGVSPINDAAMAASVRAGRVVPVTALPTFSDGTAGGVEADAITLPLCAELVDDWVLVTEAQIAQALRLVIDTRHELVEGAAAVAVAGALASRDQLRGTRVAVISCGANISATALGRMLSEPVPAGNRS